MAHHKKKTLIYAGALHGGGGIAVATMVLKSLLTETDHQIELYSGSTEISKKLQHVITDYTDRVKVTDFFHRWPSGLRYIFSKFYFFILSRFPAHQNTNLISINFLLPWRAKLIVYHVNLLSFLPEGATGVANRIRQLDAKLACYRADLNLFESGFLLDSASNFTGRQPRNAHIAYLGVDQACYRYHSQAQQFDENRILMVSSPQAHKRNEDVLEAINLINKQPEDTPIQLCIAGGQAREKWAPFIERAQQLGLASHIEFLPYLDKAELCEKMRECLCLVSASVIESFCMVAVEAMAACCPAIVTNATAMPESVGDAAIIVDTRSPEQIADAIRHLRGDKRLRDRYIRRGQEWAARFSPSSTQRKFAEYL